MVGPSVELASKEQDKEQVREQVREQDKEQVTLQDLNQRLGELI
jgi:hypothetical protein